MDEFRQAMIKTMAGKGEVVSKNRALFCVSVIVGSTFNLNT